jgi:hypothetical protein
VALMLELGPLLARAAEREVIINAVVHQMLYGLGKWFHAFEGGEFRTLWETTKWRMRYGARVPSNTQNDFDNLMKLNGMNPQIVPTSWIRDELKKLGFNLIDGVDYDALIEQEIERRTLASSQPVVAQPEPNPTPEDEEQEDDTTARSGANGDS